MFSVRNIPNIGKKDNRKIPTLTIKAFTHNPTPYKLHTPGKLQHRVPSFAQYMATRMRGCSNELYNVALYKKDQDNKPPTLYKLINGRAYTGRGQGFQ